jgi:hypothetical protein
VSRSTTATTIYTASAIQQIAAALPSFYRENEAITAGMTSGALQDLSAAPAISDTSALPDWTQALSIDARAAIAKPETRLAAIEDLMRPLAVAEAAATTQAVTTALDAEGFMTRVLVDGNLGFVEARRGHETVLVQVDGTTVIRDRAGLDDETCATSDAAFEAQMAKRGFHLVTEATTEHKSIPGGELIRAAARQNRRNLAEGALQARRAMHSTTTRTRKAVAL